MAGSLIDVLRPKLVEIFRTRWNIPDWKLHFPWWGSPAQCRILMYGDSSVQLSGGGFQGLLGLGAGFAGLDPQIDQTGAKHGAVRLDHLGVGRQIAERAVVTHPRDTSVGDQQAPWAVVP